MQPRLPVCYLHYGKEHYTCSFRVAEVSQPWLPYTMNTKLISVNMQQYLDQYPDNSYELTATDKCEQKPWFYIHFTLQLYAPEQTVLHTAQVSPTALLL